MSTLVSQITVLVIVGIIVFTVLAIFGYLPKRESKDKKFKQETWERQNKTMPNPFEAANFDGFPFERNIHEMKNDKTQFMNFWIMEQFDENGKRLKMFEINEVPEKGLVIGSANDCDFQISGCRFVGRHHAVIGQDEKGLFLQDLDSTNGMFDQNTKKIKQLEIEDGKEVYLANVKFRFRAVNPFQVKSSVKTTKENEKAETKSKWKLKRM